jgi:hypothetical protein
MVAVVVPEEFVTAFNGSLVGPDDVRYDEVRAVHNGLVDKRPGLIAQCHNAATRGWRFPFVAAGTMWPAGPSPTAV